MKRDAHFRYFMTLSDKEYKLFSLAPELKDMRDLKEYYVQFNKTKFNNKNEISEALSHLIDIYKISKYEMFRKFSILLKDNFEEILNSFTYIETIDEFGEIHCKRLSNGPIESFNRIPKDMKRNSRGYLDFEHARNRILFATRKDAAITYPKE